MSLNRRTPLKTRTPLKAKKPWRPERKPLNRTEFKRKRKTGTPRTTVDPLEEFYGHGDAHADFRAEMAGKHCEAHWDGKVKPCRRTGSHAHHRLLRSQGGRALDFTGQGPWHLAWLCEECHERAHKLAKDDRETAWVPRRNHLGHFSREPLLVRGSVRARTDGRAAYYGADEEFKIRWPQEAYEKPPTDPTNPIYGPCPERGSVWRHRRKEYRRDGKTVTVTGVDEEYVYLKYEYTKGPRGFLYTQTRRSRWNKDFVAVDKVEA